MARVCYSCRKNAALRTNGRFREGVAAISPLCERQERAATAGRIDRAYLRGFAVRHVSSEPKLPNISGCTKVSESPENGPSFCAQRLSGESPDRHASHLDQIEVPRVDRTFVYVGQLGFLRVQFEKRDHIIPMLQRLLTSLPRSAQIPKKIRFSEQFSITMPSEILRV